MMKTDRMHGRRTLCCFITVGVLVTASAMAGERVAAGPVVFEGIAVAPAPQATGFGVPIRTGELDRLRGGDASVAVDVRNQGEVGNNSATDVVSGNNHIDGGAFANATGLSTVIQNSGSNVLIQNGMAINVQFTDPRP